MYLIDLHDFYKYLPVEQSSYATRAEEKRAMCECTCAKGLCNTAWLVRNTTKLTAE